MQNRLPSGLTVPQAMHGRVVGLVIVRGGSTFTWGTAFPQNAQNLLPAGFSLPQALHAQVGDGLSGALSKIGLPHPVQNFIPGSAPKPQLGHCAMSMSPLVVVVVMLTDPSFISCAHPGPQPETDACQDVSPSVLLLKSDYKIGPGLCQQDILRKTTVFLEQAGAEVPQLFLLSKPADFH